MKDSFIPSIVNFATGEIDESVRMEMNDKYLSKPDYTYEKVEFITINNLICIPKTFNYTLEYQCFLLKFGLANAINNCLRLKNRVVYVGNLKP